MVCSRMGQSKEKWLTDTADVIANCMGSVCETAVYKIENGTSRILKIFNHRVTNRNEGDAFETFFGTENRKDREEILHNFYDGVNEARAQVRLVNGKIIKLAIAHYQMKEGHYALSVIFDATAFISTEIILRAFNGMEKDDLAAEEDTEELQLSVIFEECHSEVGVPIYSMTKQDRVELIRRLKERNVFSFQKSVPYVASRLKVSRYSVYNYLRELDAGTE